MSIFCQKVTLMSRKEIVVKDFTLEVEDERITALYGPTGSGKTALLLMFAGLIKPDSGEIVIDGISMNRRPREARQAIGLGVIPEFSPLMSSLTLEENLELYTKTLKLEKANQRVKEVMHWLELDSFAKVLTDDLPALAGAKASLALATLNHAKTILLDEPEYRLMTEEMEIIWGYLLELKGQGKGIIISTRYQEIAEKCDQIVSISRRKVVPDHETESTCGTRTQTALT